MFFLLFAIHATRRFPSKHWTLSAIIRGFEPQYSSGRQHIVANRRLDSLVSRLEETLWWAKGPLCQRACGKGPAWLIDCIWMRNKSERKHWKHYEDLPCFLVDLRTHRSRRLDKIKYTPWAFPRWSNSICQSCWARTWPTSCSKRLEASLAAHWDRLMGVDARRATIPTSQRLSCQVASWWKEILRSSKSWIQDETIKWH